MSQGKLAVFLALIMVSLPLSGCFGEDESGGVVAGDVTITPATLSGGVFQAMTLKADKPLSVFIPYLIKDDVTGFIQNSTVIDLGSDESVQISVLAPPRTDMALVMVGESGRNNWPIRDATESWRTWYGNTGFQDSGAAGVSRIMKGNFSTVNHSMENGGPVGVVPLSISREMSDAYSEEEGGRHSAGIISGRDVYNHLHHITDETFDQSDCFPLVPLGDCAVGYLDRWAGQGNVAYEDAVEWLDTELTDYGLEVQRQRFEFTDVFDKTNPEAYNICGYKWGEIDRDKWMVFGAHFDIAPPANAVLIDPHLTGTRTYGTRVGAYDNTAGTSMVLTVAEAMANFKTRNSIVFCLWSGEEGGKRGSDYWTESLLENNPEVEVTNYVNLDMAGVNWPGGGGAPHGDPAPTIDPEGYPKDEEVWPMRVYIGPSGNHDLIDQPEIVGLSSWIASDAIGVEQETKVLVGAGFDAATWKVDDWLAKDRPEIIIYEDTTARSDHASFQDNLGTVTLGFGGLVDGYWCYHQTCDTLEEMEQWMDTTDKGYGEEQSGVSNLVDGLDLITWWATYSFFHLDETPIGNTL